MLRALRKQYDSLIDHIREYKMNEIMLRTHPMIPIRFKAIELAALDIILLRERSYLFNVKSFSKIDHQIGKVIESIDLWLSTG